MKSGSEMIAEAKSRIRESSVAALKQSMGTGAQPVILDVREPNETNLGCIPGAIVIPRGTLETKVEAMIPRAATIVIYCASGNRSAFAADTLQQMGYKDVTSLAAGWSGWVTSGGPVEG